LKPKEFKSVHYCKKKNEIEKGRQQGDVKTLYTMSVPESKTKVMGTIPVKKVAFFYLRHLPIYPAPPPR